MKPARDMRRAGFATVGSSVLPTANCTPRQPRKPAQAGARSGYGTMIADEAKGRNSPSTGRKDACYG